MTSPADFYGYETWSFLLKEQQRLRMLDNRVLRKIFEPMMEDVNGTRRKLYSEELRDLYHAGNIQAIK
jgi:hypothetical protein